MKQHGNLSTEISLVAIQGLSIWQQSRLHQEHVENAQNLATADLPVLIVNTPFTLAQLTDWIDQAILLVCTSPTQIVALKEAGIRTASDLLLVARVDPDLNQLSLASSLNPNGLQILSIALRATSNIKDILHLRYQFNAETASSLGPLSSVAALGSNLANDEVSAAD